MDHLTVDTLKPLSECSHNLTIDGNAVNDADPNSISEWAINCALAKIGIGNSVTMKEFQLYLDQACIDEALKMLSEKGLIDISVDLEGKPVFNLTEQGKLEAKKFL